MRIYFLALTLVFAAQSGNAADFGEAPTTYDWSGFYAGAHVGGTVSNSEWGGGPPEAFGIIGPFGTDYTYNSLLGGGQLGVDFQSNSLVYGIRAEISGAAFGGADTCNELDPPPTPGALLRCGDNPNWMASVAGRVGYAYDTTLLYVLGGVSWLNADYRVGRGEDFAFWAGSEYAEETTIGWAVGLGVEHAFASNWSIFFEGRYQRFEADDVVLECCGGFEDAPVDIDHNIGTLKVGLNYRFGGHSD